MAAILIVLGGRQCNAQTVIKLTQANGTYIIPCSVNGVSMQFTFDTGAAVVVISLKEARYLYNKGLLKEDDFVGASRYQVANGEIVEGANIILKRIDVADLSLFNVEATILPMEDADLLLGQTALSRLGTFQFDYSNNTLTIFREHQASNRANNALSTTGVTGAVLDVEGNMYRTVKVGSQVWMAENLATSHYSNGDAIPLLENNQMWNTTSSGASCWYENINAYAKPCGKLYNHYAVTDKRNICPAGWHTPTDTDWLTLSHFLGGISIAGGKLKSTDTGYWEESNTTASNESGFNAVPCGYRYPSGSFSFIGRSGWFWSSSYVEGEPSYYFLTGKSTEMNKFEFSTLSRDYGLSVRCIADDTPKNP